MGEQLTYGYVGDIVKYDQQPDGSLMVYGVATSPTVDHDGQACDPAWLRKAMPKWFEFGNVREQHGPIAAGVGVELTEDDSGKWWLKSHVVDPGTVDKVKKKVLKGYSIGVRNGQVLRGKAAGHAKNGVIMGGDVAEVSLVDRPCNPDGLITIAKSVGGTDLLAVDDHGDVLDDVDTNGAGSIDVDDEAADSQDVDGAVDGDELDDDGDGLTLFDEFDAEYARETADDFGDVGPELIEDAEGLAKALELPGTAGIMITKGLLETLLNGPKPGKKPRDSDGDGKTGESSEAKKLAAQRKARRAAQARQRDDDRKHRQRSDAEHAQDAVAAGRAGRGLEAGEHRRRMGTYDKALDLTSGLSAAEHREAQRLMRDVLAGDITKSVDVADVDADAEAVAVLAELAISELEQLAMGDFDADHDPHLLIDAVTALAKMFGGRGVTLTKAVDTSTGEAVIVGAAVIEKAVSEATQVLKGQVASLTAQVAEISSKPIPGGPVLMKTVSAPLALPAAQQAIQRYTEISARPDLDPSVAEAYRIAAERQAAA
jgi:hypothetical protein